jgi:hypothetical protein
MKWINLQFKYTTIVNKNINLIQVKVQLSLNNKMKIKDIKKKEFNSKNQMVLIN